MSNDNRNNWRLEKAFEFCKILQVESIKNEINDLIKSCTLNDIKLENRTWNCRFSDKNDNYISLNLSRDKIYITKSTDDTKEIIFINDNHESISRKIEKRENGIVYEITKKDYDFSKRFNNKIVLTDIENERYIFTNNNLEKLNINSNNTSLAGFLIKFRKLEREINLISRSDLYNIFSSHMNYYYKYSNGRNNYNNIYPTITNLNGQNVSSIYDLIDGEDKIYRVFDLYKGIINPRNEKDLHSIHLGLMNSDSYDLKSLKGITEKENELIGKSLENNQDYINYLKELFKNRYNYNEEIKFNRDFILNDILLKSTPIEKANYNTKKSLEDILGIQYEEYSKLSIEKKYKLIEEKTGNKIKSDHRIYIDGIPMDKNHIITKKQITNNSPKKILRKLLRPRN